MHDRVRVGRYIFVWVDGNESRGADPGIDVVGHKPFSNAWYDDIIQNRWENGKVRDDLQPLV